MVKLTNQEVENMVRDMLEGKTTRQKIIRDLKIDRVSLNNRIQELSVYNPELYEKFIKKFPYKPREYTHIDWEALLIDIMKKMYTKAEAEEQYEVSSMTIQRKVHTLENRYIAELYKEVGYYRRHKKALPPELQEKVDNLPEKEIFIGGMYDKKEAELMDLEKKYNNELAQGRQATTASANCGKERVSKSLNTLYRIKIEQNTKEQLPKTVDNKRTDESREER